MNDSGSTNRTAAPTSAAADGGVPWPKEALGWYAVGVLTIAYILSFIDRSIIALLVGPIRADLGVTDTQLSLLQGFAFAIFYTTLGIPMALLADRLNRRNIIAAGILFWSVATMLCGAAKSYWQLFAARIGVGVGEAVLSPSVYSMISDLFPPHRLGRALAVYTVGAFAGAGLAFLIGGAVIGSVASGAPVWLPLVGEVRLWQMVFMIVGAPGLVIALWAMTLPEPARRGAKQAAPSPRLRTAFAALLAHMRANRQTYVSHLAGFSLLGVVFNGTMSWFPAYLTRVFEIPPGRSGLWIGSLLLVFGSLGVLIGGWLTDRWRERGHSDSSMRVGLFSALCAIPFGFGTTLTSSFALCLIGFAGLMFFTSMPYGAAATAIQLVTPPRMRATASSLYLCCLNLVGLGGGATLVALFTDYLFQNDLAVG
ncbi:MAG: MFS transporter, partial [Pseudomonadales bacterium]|nr:MFS transporter [Pseudomonadales bacterium]